MDNDDRKDFHAERLTGIGGSDCAAIFNLGYGCQRRLWYDKRKVAPDYPIKLAPELERGTLLEPVVCELYRRRTGREVIMKPLQRHFMYDWMIVHVDGETTSPDKVGPGYAEFKCVNRFAMKDFKKTGIREQYILQLQHGMAVCEYKWGSFGILCLDPWEFLWFDAERDDSIIWRIITEGSVLWEKIESGTMPEALPEATDRRCLTCPWRKTCRSLEFDQANAEALKEGVQIERDDSLTDLVKECVELGELSNEADDLKEDAKKELKKAIGERLGVIVPGFRALYTKSFPEPGFDLEALKALEVKAKKVHDDYCLMRTDTEQWKFIVPAIDIIRVFLNSRKAKKKEATRTLRIYSTGD